MRCLSPGDARVRLASQPSMLLLALALAGCGRTPYEFARASGGSDPSTSGTTEIGPGDTTPGNDGSLPTSTVTTSPTTATTTFTTSTDTTDSTSTGQPSCMDNRELCTIELSLRRAVDILFVVDNSGSMGGEQGTMAQSFASFINVLEAQEVGANYRIGVTTTAGNGILRATSCRARLGEFIFSSPTFGDVDATQEGCLDHCDIDEIVVANPWVEKTSGQTNLPAGVSMAEALQCIGPQGINGPGLERPLESMRASLVDNNNGFMRDDALLAVIFVTDEADCSMDNANQTWLQTQGQVYWTHPERASSGVCWTTGVQCTGGPGVFNDCVAQDWAQDGMPTNDEQEAILFPLSRYIDALTDIAAQKQVEGGQGEVLVALLAGVPLDHPQTGATLYADSSFDDFNLEYGIGPGCGVGTETITDPPGIPPVRLREFAESFATQGRNVFSICSEDYGIAMTQIADAIGEINERACISGCVVDADEGSMALEPDCSLIEIHADGSPDEQVGPCDIFDQGWDFPSADTHVCFRALTDTEQQTASSADDMSAQCVTVGSNVEFVIERRPGVPVAAGTSVEVNCQLAAPVGITCAEIE